MTTHGNDAPLSWAMNASQKESIVGIDSYPGSRLGKGTAQQVYALDIQGTVSF